MRTPDMLSVLGNLSTERYVLVEGTRAIELGPDHMGKMRLGPVSTLPVGSEVEYCGQGFNANTVRVRCRGRFYFIYRQDLEAQRQTKAAFASAGNSWSISTRTVPLVSCRRIEHEPVRMRQNL